MNTESILNQFDIVEKSITRAILNFDVNMLHKEAIEVSLYELIKSYHQIENLIREISPEKFGHKEVKSILYPPLTVKSLDLCPYCGDAECTSDHK